MENYKSRKRTKIINKSDDPQLKKIKEIIESKDPYLDEPIICELISAYLYQVEFGAPPYYLTHYKTVGREVKRGGSIPLTMRELKIIEIIGIPKEVYDLYYSDKKRGNVEDVVDSRDVLVGYEKYIKPYNSILCSRSIEQKQSIKLSDMDKERLEKRKAEIKSNQVQSSDKKGILRLNDYTNRNSKCHTVYEIETTAQQAALLGGLIKDFQNYFKTYEQIKEEKGTISFETISRAIGKFFERGEGR